MSAPGGASPRLAVINGLRGWAIFGVMYHHMAAWLLSPLSPGTPALGPLRVSPHALLSNGWLGVNLFFVLSGFVLASPYANGARDMSTPGVRAYYRQRALRLLPLYYFFLLAILFLREPSNLASVGFLEDVWRMASFTFVFDRRSFFPRFNMALWSLGVEFWFSVVFPLLVLAWRRLGISPVLVLSLAACLLVRIAAARLHPATPTRLDFLKDGVFGRLDDFVVGMALAEAHARGRLPSRGLATVAVVVGIALMFCCAVAWDSVVLRSLPYSVGPYLNLVAQAAFASLTLGLLGAAPALLKLPFTAHPIQLAGMMCYSLYLWHVVGLHGPYWDATDIPVYLVLAVLLSAATYRYVEFPRRTVKELFLPA